jgi:hypothetical protein
VTGQLADWTSGAYTAVHWLARPAPLIALGLLAAVAAVPQARRWFPAAALVAFAAGAATWTLNARLTEGQRAELRDLQAAQLWARAHTPPGTLFLVDPVLRYPVTGYGWREYALRGSWGSLREWLLTGWNYTSDYATCREGLRRLNEFGIEIEDYWTMDPPRLGLAALMGDLRRRYYRADDAWRRGVADRYGLQFMVSNRLDALETALPVAFQNDRIVIHDLRPGTPASSAEGSRP